MKKFAPLLAGIALVTLFTGCVSNSYESGKRTNILFGLVDYKSDYRNVGYIYDPADAGVLNNSIITSNPIGAVSGYNESVDGKKLTVLWGLGGTYKWQ